MKIKNSRQRKRIILRCLLIICVLIFLSAAFIEWRVKPVVASVASVQAKGFAVTAVNRAAAEVLREYDIPELESVTSSDEGLLRSVSTDRKSVV